jgi:peptidoglycan hydrolase-like protein with peptidoglycan-binding domain
MDWRTYAVVVLLVAPSLTIGSSSFTSIHPEEAYPDPQPPALADPYSGLVSTVQERLRLLGFDPGPVNGDFGAKTQAALTQFQLAAGVRESGQLDAKTLSELGIDREGSSRP